MRFLIEEYSEDDYYNNRLYSKFDKWLGYDFGGIRTFAKGLPEINNDEENWYLYEETWNFIGRQKDGKYYFMCSSSYDKNMIGQVLSFDKFNDVAYMIMLPGRRY